uniref:hypothetical protein n=1 Tax=Candidatus Nitrotoga sp. BS TaxID=2890408 RepID=UPI001EF1B370|nr:hypothetical protein [Candidatus Nitrotoga sp. BS]
MQSVEPDRFSVISVKPGAVGDSTNSGRNIDTIVVQSLAGIAARPEPDSEGLQKYRLAVVVAGAMDNL